MHKKRVSKFNITNDTLIILMGLFYPALSNYIWRVVVIVPSMFGLYFTNQVFDMTVWSLVFLYILLTNKKRPLMSLTSLLLALIYVIVTLFSFIFTSYDYFTVSVLVTMLTFTFSFFFQGTFLNMKRVSHKQVYIGAIVTLIVSMLYSIITMKETILNLDDNMDFAYKLLPAVLVIISWLFTENKKITAIVFSVIGTIFLLMQGTRGPMFCLAVFVCLMLYKKHGFGKSFFKIGTIVLVVALLLDSKAVRLKLIDSANKIDNAGYSARFITMFLEGEISDSNGREAIKERLIGHLKENPLQIRGFYADRQATRGLVDTENSTSYSKGTYAHSIWIEMMYDWGVFFGGIILLLLFLKILKIIIKCDKTDAYIVMVYVCTSVVHLFLSGSYLTSTSLFFFVGLALNYHISTKPEIEE